MLPGQPPIYQLMKPGPIVSKDGQLSLVPVAGAVTIEGAHFAASHMKLENYLIVLNVCVFAKLPASMTQPAQPIDVSKLNG